MDVAVINAVANRIPRYNEYLLRGFMNQQICKSVEFIGSNFNEAIKLFGGAIVYKGYRIPTPEQRAEKELAHHNNGCPITRSDLILVEYIFEYQDKLIPTLLYIPYLRNDVILIDDTAYVLQKSIKERVFSRTTNGITMKVIRQPIPFYRTVSYRLESALDAKYWLEWVPTTVIHRLYRTNRRKSIDATVLLYLLCKFGFIGTLARFGWTETDIVFVEEIGSDTAEYEYFPARRIKKKTSVDLFVKVRRVLLDNRKVTKFLASLLYTVTAFQKQRLESLYESTGVVFRIMLGKIINGNNISEGQSNDKIKTHIASLDTYLDPSTQMRLQAYGIQTTDIYDVLQYIFEEIEHIILEYSHTNLYHSRIDVIEELLVETIVKAIYGRFYNVDKDPKKLKLETVEKMLRFPRDLIKKLYKSHIVRKNPPVYGDNAAVSHLISKIRQSGLSNSGRVIRSPDHRFHPSMAVVESLISFSKTNPGAGGSINPYLQITPDGSVVRPAYSTDIDDLERDLPY